MSAQGTATLTSGCQTADLIVLFIMAAVIVGRVAYLLATGSRKNAKHLGRFWGFALGYSVLAATSADVFIETWNGQPLTGHSLLFLLASNLLIFFRGGDHKKEVSDHIAECFVSGRKK